MSKDKIKKIIHNKRPHKLNLQNNKMLKNV